MITDRISPPGLLELPGLASVTVATGTKLVSFAGQTGVDAEGKVVGASHRDQARQAFLNLRTAMDAAGVAPDGLSRLNIYVVDYDEDALAAIYAAAYEVMGEELVPTASTLVGVAALWQPDVLIEIDALAVV